MPVVLAVCDAAAAKIGPPVRGAEPAWSCVEALRAATTRGGHGLAAGMAKEGELFSRVSAKNGLWKKHKYDNCGTPLRSRFHLWIYFGRPTCCVISRLEPIVGWKKRFMNVWASSHTGNGVKKSPPLSFYADLAREFCTFVVRRGTKRLFRVGHLCLEICEPARRL